MSEFNASGIVIFKVYAVNIFADVGFFATRDPSSFIALEGEERVGGRGSGVGGRGSGVGGIQDIAHWIIITLQ